MGEGRYAAPFKLSVAKYGGILSAEQSVVTVNTTATEVAAGDPERVLLTLVNLSLNVMFVSPETRVSTTRGIRLGPNGGFLSMNAELDGILTTLAWFAVTDVGSGGLYRIEERRINIEEGA